MNYYSHHIGDYTTDTAHLSLLEDGAYRRLLDRYYTTEAPLPADEAALFRLVRARATDEQEAVRVVLAEFFAKGEGGWTHKRCDAEISAFRAKSGKAAEAANKRWHKPADATAMRAPDAPAMPAPCERTANAMPTRNQEPVTNNQEPLPKVNSTAAGKPPAARRTAAVPDEVQAVFGYWQQVMGHGGARPDAKRVRAILARLDDGYTVGDLCRAVDGCKVDPFSQGANDRQSVYDDIELICRDGPKVDKFKRIAEQGAPRQRNGAQALGKAAQATARNMEAWLQEKQHG